MKKKRKKPKVKDVRGDLIARLRQEADAWELVIAKNGHPVTLAQRLEEYMTALDQERKEKEATKIALAALFRDVRDTISLEEEFEGTMPILMRLEAIVMPATMIRWATKLTKQRLWQKVTVLLNNFVYDRYHGSLSSVTTVKKSPNTPRQPMCGRYENLAYPDEPHGRDGHRHTPACYTCPQVGTIHTHSQGPAGRETTTATEMCSGYPNYNGCGKPHGHEGMCIPGEPGYIRPKAVLPGDCCGDD